MFNIGKDYIEDEYRKEVSQASINHYTEEEKESNENSRKNRLIPSIFATITVGAIGYFGFNYMQDETNSIKKTAVMGVHIENESISNSVNRVELAKELESLYMNEQKEERQKEIITSLVNDFMSEKEQPSNKSSEEISKELDSMVNRFYTQKSIPTELDSMVNSFYSEETTPKPQKRVVTIHQGDTLGSISTQYYGTHKKVQKIIDANYNLSSDSSTLTIGQKITIPY